MKSRSLSKEIAKKLCLEPTIDADVFLDGVPESYVASDKPLIIVSATNNEGLVTKDGVWTVQIVVAVDSSRYVNNAATPEKTLDGYYEIGAGDILDGLVDSVMSLLSDWDLGAIPDDFSCETNYASLPVQFATITATFACYRAF